VKNYKKYNIKRLLEFIDWKALGGEYLQVNMYKAGIDTMNAINVISKKVK
jgi:tRNA(Glu) U13 pseudouridine synthase TruD